MRPVSLALGALAAVVSLGVLSFPGIAQGVYPSNPVQTALLPVGDAPFDLALSADDSVYVLTYDSSAPGRIVVFDAAMDDSVSYPAGLDPKAIAVNSNNPTDPHDDTVYVTLGTPGQLLVYSNGMDDSRTVSFATGTYPGSIAVDPTDDTVYIGTWASPNLRIITLRGSSLDDSTAFPLVSRASSIAVDADDDTVYLTHDQTPNVGLTYSGPSFDDSVFLPGTISGATPWKVAVNSTDDSVYVGLSRPSSVLMLSAQANFDDSTVRTLGTSTGLSLPAVTVASDGSTVYALETNGAQGPVYVMRSTNLDDSTSTSLAGPGNNYPTAIVASASMAFTSNDNGDSMSVVSSALAPAIVAVNPSSGSPAGGNTVTITGAGFVRMVSTVTLGGTLVPGAQVVSPTMITFPAPAHASGSADVTVTTGRLSATVVNGYSWVSPSPPPPPPPPVYPPSAPREVRAEPGNASATVSWQGPADTGTYPVTRYEVRSLPETQPCLTEAIVQSCEMRELVNGTAYEFEVRALNGAGWGPWSAASDPVTPMRPTIVITGSRGSQANGGLAMVAGDTTGLVGGEVKSRVRLSGQPKYRTGVTRPVDTDGAFTWQRRTPRKVYVYFVSGDVRSNRVVIPAA